MANEPRVEAARAAALACRWAEAERCFRDLDPAELDGPALDDLADTHWWRCRLEESIAARQRAYAAHHAAGAAPEAAMAAWRLFDAHLMSARERVAAGWLRCARRRLEGVPECAVHGYLAFADSEGAFQRSDLAAAWEAAGRMGHLGERHGDSDLAAMGTVVRGRVRVAEGLVEEGLGLLDEAMCAVLAEETTPLFTGWIHCLVVSDCFAVGDLERAQEWTEAAMTWCESLDPEAPYHGMCRIKRVELSALRGDLDGAERECRRACDELLAYQPASAAEGYTVLGEILRRRGAAADADRSFARARDLGGDGQPGLALVRLALGDPDVAADMLEGRGSVSGMDPASRARHLTAVAEVAHARGDLPALKSAAAGLAEYARSTLEGAAADLTTARLRLMEGRPATALVSARRAHGALTGIGLPFEAAQARMLAGTARAEEGDLDGARQDWAQAREQFALVGARADAEHVSGLLGPATRLPHGLTPREAQVLRLVATGRSNRCIAAGLHISEHTVARHMNNIFTKLGVSSRAAATAIAFRSRLV
ncbi:LuxR family transcriptional regulator [Nocardiopsis metallicus]|uniref:ATP/maltotriose-dependent transcriptional regulator MalT n=1 Tax=Nocardiopsis metallicus TaxID=179819 RepID=A0A840WGQ2_9ACTN|nr:LuxR family transcriptional regulator [Nocardiopsis metallicus]MBB5490576.1 ATP/maltotriose-dependent transcriptional regulator MalT [Nocardiopsis metallicus]